MTLSLYRCGLQIIFNAAKYKRCAIRQLRISIDTSVLYIGYRNCAGHLVIMTTYVVAKKGNRYMSPIVN